MESHRIGLRAYDIQGGLKDLSSGLIEARMRVTKRVGMALRLGLHLRGPENYVITDKEKLIVVAGELGISFDSVLPTLKVLEEVGFCHVQGSLEESPFKLEVSVPVYRDCYSALGEYWKSHHPGEVEVASLELLDQLAALPETMGQVQASLANDPTLSQYVLEIGRFAGYVDVLPNAEQSERLVYSPLYWDENAATFQEVITKKAPEDVRELVLKIRGYQGLPSAGIPEPLRTLVITSGILPAPTVSSTNGRHEFLFTPVAGLKTLDKQVLDNARAVLSSVRYGEHFAGITKIRGPEAILQALLDARRSHRIGSHSEIRDQYSVLVRRGLGVIEPDKQRPGRHFFRLIPTIETLSAVKLALDLVVAGESLEARGLDEATSRVLFQPGSYQGPLPTIMRYKREPTLSPKMQQKVVADINDLLQGAIIR